jgi:glycosyltransferase involved in cell wall biosynthesis
MESIRMKFSIITPSYNHGHFIEQTILSVMHQEGCDIEHIIMDGGSKDGTVEVLKKYPHLNWISEKDKGQADAINRGVLKSHGDIIAWLNSDDYYHENVLKEVALYFEKHQDCQFLYGNLTIVDESGNILATDSGDTMGYEALLKNPDAVRQPCSLWRRDVFEKVGMLNENLHLVMDFEFFMRVSKQYKMHYLDKDLCHFRLHENCKSLQFSNRQLDEIKSTYAGISTEPAKLFNSFLFNRKKQKIRQTVVRYLKLLRLR